MYGIAMPAWMIEVAITAAIAVEAEGTATFERRTVNGDTLPRMRFSDDKMFHIELSGMWLKWSMSNLKTAWEDHGSLKSLVLIFGDEQTVRITFRV